MSTQHVHIIKIFTPWNRAQSFNMAFGLGNLNLSLSLLLGKDLTLSKFFNMGNLSFCICKMEVRIPNI